MVDSTQKRESAPKGKVQSITNAKFPVNSDTSDGVQG